VPDQFAGYVAGLNSPAFDAADVTPNDGADLPNTCRGLWVGVGGNIKVTTKGGTTVVIVGVPSGFVVPICVKRVWSASTTAASILALT